MMKMFLATTTTAVTVATALFLLLLCSSRTTTTPMTADAFVVTTTTTGVVVVSRNAASTRTTTRLHDVSAREALERTKRRLRDLQREEQQEQEEGSSTSSSSSKSKSIDPRVEAKVREYLSYPANALKAELKSNGLLSKGRKPDLARRLAEYEHREEHPDECFDDGVDVDDDASSRPRDVTGYLDPKKRKKGDDDDDGENEADRRRSDDDDDGRPLESFCGLRLSETAATALGAARFDAPTPIQAESLPVLTEGRSAILHAETGSGKTLAYLLPITEALWRDQESSFSEVDDDLMYGLVLTPTRELAAQVAGVASALAPPGSVRLVTEPTNLMSEGRYWKERRGDRTDDPGFLAEETEARGRGSPPRLFVGSAKALLASLYGDERMPASPTRKPAAKELLSRTRWVVLDEVDRLLRVGSKKGLSTRQRNRNAEDGKTGPLHEKPAAVLTAAVARRTLGRAQVIAASATVGRSLKRELSRVLGLPPKEHPPVFRGDGVPTTTTTAAVEGQHVDRAVTIPGSVRNYVLPVDESSNGKLLTTAFFAIKNLNNNNNNNNGGSSEKILLVLTKGCGITTSNAIGALRHFRCEPEPRSLLDVLQDADGTDQLMDVHRSVAGSDGVGADDEDDVDVDDGYVLVTGEDTVRGMHLAGLDTVVVVGRANGPDEYVHIAGRTGRAGKPGKVLNVLSEPNQVSAVKAWETILRADFRSINMEDVAAGRL